MRGSVSREGEYAVIRVHMDDVHAFRVALKPIRAGEVTSNATQAVRDGIDKALAALVSRRTVK